MTNSIYSHRAVTFEPFSLATAASDPLQTIAHRSLSVREADTGLAQVGLSHLLSNPVNLVMGGMWSLFLGVGASLSFDSLRELRRTITVESSTSEYFLKIGLAVKGAFKEVISFAGTCAYTVHWADEIKLISLGSKATLFRCLGYASSLTTSTLEGATAIYNIYLSEQAISTAQTPLEEEKHKQYLNLHFMKLIASVTMIFWASLGIDALAAGAALGLFPMTCLAVSCVFFFTALSYEKELKNRWFPAPNLNPLPRG